MQAPDVFAPLLQRFVIDSTSEAPSSSESIHSNNGNTTELARASVLRDISLSAIVVGFVTVLVGFTSSAAIVFQVAQSLGATADHICLWKWALGLGIGVTCIALLWSYRIPYVTAWSTPGAPCS